MKHDPVIYSTTYDRDATKIGIVHLGYGAFHRAHQAVFVDDYLQETGDLNWGIAAVNLRATESDDFAKVQAAKEGYLLKTTSSDGSLAFRMVRAHLAFEDWAVDAEKTENLLALDSVHAVTITVTESGYYVNDDWSLNTSDPAIADELNGGDPKTVYAFLARGIARRIAAGGGALTIMCCDNIRSNGKMLAQNFVDYLEKSGSSDIAAWVRDNVTFPCSMVDRITPRAGDDLLDEVAALIPNQDVSPIHAEDFIQWVLADNFAGPFPDLAKAGVEVVDDVDPYEEAKIRILNGGHTALAYLGVLAGYDTFDQAMADPELRKHFDGWEFKEVLPGLTIDLPFDKTAYTHSIADRFNNPAIADQLSRICMDGWSKMPIYVRPTLRSCLAQGITPTFAYDSVASWYVYARRIANGQLDASYREPYWDTLLPLLAQGQEEAFASVTALWAELPTQFNEFVPGIVSAIKRMEEKWPI